MTKPETTISQDARDLSERIERRIEQSLKAAGIKITVASVMLPELIQHCLDKYADEKLKAYQMRTAKERMATNV